MKPYEPERLPLDCIDWAAHVSLIGQANAALARYDGTLQSIINPVVLLESQLLWLRRFVWFVLAALFAFVLIG
jgi:hypothetical protein